MSVSQLYKQDAIYKDLKKTSSKSYLRSWDQQLGFLLGKLLEQLEQQFHDQSTNQLIRL